MFSAEFTFQCWKLFIFRITNLLKLNLININTGLWQRARGGGDDTVEIFHEFELMTNCLAKLFHYGFKVGGTSFMTAIIKRIINFFFVRKAPALPLMKMICMPLVVLLRRQQGGDCCNHPSGH